MRSPFWPSLLAVPLDASDDAGHELAGADPERLDRLSDRLALR